MSPLAERGNLIALVGEAISAGARQSRACEAISLSERTVRRWQRDSLQRPLHNCNQTVENPSK